MELQIFKDRSHDAVEMEGYENAAPSPSLYKVVFSEKTFFGACNLAEQAIATIFRKLLILQSLPLHTKSLLVLRAKIKSSRDFLGQAKKKKVSRVA